MAHAHYKYSDYCCGGQDCGVIVNITRLPNGDRFITIDTTLGSKSAIFPRDFKLTPPIDDKEHACILHDGSPRCLYLNGGS